MANVESHVNFTGDRYCGFAGDKESESDLNLRVCGSVVVCRVERGLRKP